MAESDLQRRLEALGQRVLADIEAWEQRTRAERARTIEAITRQVGAQVGAAIATAQKSHEQARLGRRALRNQKRAEQRAQQREEASIGAGLVQLAIAAVCIAFAILRPDLWWLIFVALGVGVGGSRQLGLVAQRRRLERAEREEEEAPAKAPLAPHEVDALCDQLLADLKASPEAVRSFLQQPEKTVESLRSTCKALDARRKQLSAEDAKGRLEDLTRQRTELSARRDTTKDAEARRKLDEALKSLESQADALGQLSLLTERVDGEYTSLLILLQELKTRVAVAKSTGTGVQLTGLRENVTRLNAELGAISEAMEAVKRDDVRPIAEIESAPPSLEGTKERV